MTVSVWFNERVRTHCALKQIHEAL